MTTPTPSRAARSGQPSPDRCSRPYRWVTLPELRLLVVGGEALAPARFRHWIDRHQVANAYGPTEATIATHVAPHLMADNQPAPLGRSVPGVEDFLLDEDDQPVPDGQPGHLHLAGVGLDDGYPGLPDRTVNAFPRLRIGGRAVRVYRTGDRARRRPDGQLVYAGRIDRQLNLGGVRLEPEEVEAAAPTLDGVTAAAMLAEPAGGRDVLALHVAVPCGRITEAALRAHLAGLLPSTAVPARIHLYPSLPLTGYGQPDLRALTVLAFPGAPLAAEPDATAPAVAADNQAVALPNEVRGGGCRPPAPSLPPQRPTSSPAVGTRWPAFGLEIPLSAFTAPGPAPHPPRPATGVQPSHPAPVNGAIPMSTTPRLAAPVSKGDRIGIVTVSAPEPADLPDVFSHGVQALTGLGFEVVVGAHATGRSGYRAGTTDELLDDFHQMIADPSIAAVLCAGGGRNSNRILSGLDLALIAANPKLIVGVSDPSLLLNAITSRTGLVTLHGPSVMWDLAVPDAPCETVEHFTAMLAGQSAAARIAPP